MRQQLGYDGAQSLREGQSVLSRGSGEHSHVAEFCKLQCQTSDTTGGAVNDECPAGCQMQGIVDSLNGSQPGGCNRARLLETESSRDVADAIGRHRDEFRIEASLGIVPAVRVGRVADLEAAHVGSHCRNNAGAVCPEHQRKAGMLDAFGVASHAGVPDPNTRRVHGDQHFIRIRFRDRQRVQDNDLRSAGSIDCSRLHRLGQLRRTPAVCGLTWHHAQDRRWLDRWFGAARHSDRRECGNCARPSACWNTNTNLSLAAVQKLAMAPVVLRATPRIELRTGSSRWGRSRHRKNSKKSRFP